MRDEIESTGIAEFPEVSRNEGETRQRVSSSSLRPRPSSLLFWLVHISRFGLAALWLFAAAMKIYMRNDPAESFFKNMPYLVGERWAGVVAVGVIAAEIVAALLLLWPRTARVGALLSAVMLIGFMGYALYYRFGLGNAEGLECGCFGGIIGSQLGVPTALRNLALLVPAAIIIFGLPRLRNEKQLNRS
jgi:uncharacterized membrane protein YphA (DoxX/SURF4 family)